MCANEKYDRNDVIVSTSERSEINLQCENKLGTKKWKRTKPKNSK